MSRLNIIIDALKRYTSYADSCLADHDIPLAKQALDIAIEMRDKELFDKARAAKCLADAAPDMLSALIQIVESNKSNADLCYAIDAIRKATGNTYKRTIWINAYSDNSIDNIWYATEKEAKANAKENCIGVFRVEM